MLNILLKEYCIENEKCILSIENSINCSTIFCMESQDITAEMVMRIKQDIEQKSNNFYKKMMQQLISFYDSKEFLDKKNNILLELKKNSKIAEKKIKIIFLKNYLSFEEKMRKKFLVKNADFQELVEATCSESNDFAENTETTTFTPVVALRYIQNFRTITMNKLRIRQKTVESIIAGINLEDAKVPQKMNSIKKQVRSLNWYDKHYVEFILDYAKINLETVEKAVLHKMIGVKES